MYTIKFKFHLVNGKVFECFEELSENQFRQIVDTCKTSMREGVDGVLSFTDCALRLSEVAVVEWEVLNEQETEKS